MFTARKYESGEYLNITGITRDQAGDYECGAENDIASPDTKTVRVTVNCEYHILILFMFVYCQCWIAWKWHWVFSTSLTGDTYWNSVL